MVDGLEAIADLRECPNLEKNRWGERPREPLKPVAYDGSRGRSPHQIRTLPDLLAAGFEKRVVFSG